MSTLEDMVRDFKEPWRSIALVLLALFFLGALIIPGSLEFWLPNV